MEDTAPMRKEPIELMSKRGIEKMRAVGKLAAQMLFDLGQMVKPGISTADLDDAAVKWAKEHDVINAPLGYPGGPGSFPRSICTSVNEVVCHGIPNANHVLKDGDIINIDVTPILDGYHGDTSRTFIVGTARPEIQKLVDVTEECLRRGILAVKPGGRLREVGAAIEAYAESEGFSVVRDFVGHGIGRIFHTAPQVTHYDNGDRTRLKPGMVFTIEPMINVGTWKIKVLDDGWTAHTLDGKLSAQFEHTIAVTEDGVEILTLREGDTFL